MIRALIFDLDDTLCPERQFIRSGFHAVASEVAHRFGVPQRAVLATLFRALRKGNRAQAFQELCRQHDLPVTIVPDLIQVVRAHKPALKLPASSAEILGEARARGWRLGVITNGLPDVQARKAQALSLGGLVDAIVYANECGTRIGKPAIEPFQAVLDRLGTMAAACVFVGNDPWCDVMGARQAGFHTILLCRHEYGRLLAPACEPDVRVHAMDEVIVAAERIWRGDMVDAV